MKTPPVVIGCSELVSLPEWGISQLKAKIDTGARSSALHVEHIRELPGDVVTFDVRLHREKSDRRVKVRAKISRRGRVRSSTGHSESRLFVQTTLRIGPVEREVELSLVDRGKMIYRMLIGRRSLSHAVLIDPGRRYVLGKPAAKRKAASPTPHR
jgi:hypothetical protein